MIYKSLGRTGVRVSQVALGTGNFGTRWGHGADFDASKAILDAYVEAGGNFIDTADIYQFGGSEEILGSLLEGRREEFLLATKFTSGATSSPNRLVIGNSRKSMVACVEASLKRLKTDRIDLYWVHQPDPLVPSEEIVRGLDDLSRAGKILYAGLSNFPAWRISRAATIAEFTNAVPIAAAQFEYSLVHRDAEQDLLKVCKALGIASIGWSPLGGGVLTGKYRKGETGRREAFGGRLFKAEDNELRTNTVDTVISVAEELGATPDQVAIAWLLSQNVLPILGPRSLAQIKSNLGVTTLNLLPEHVARLTAVSKAANGGMTPRAASLDDASTQLLSVPVA